MKRAQIALATLLVVVTAALAEDDFSKRLADYMKLRKTATSQVGMPKSATSMEVIKQREQNLAKEIRTARANAKKGDVFTPAIAGEFRRLLAVTMSGAEALAIRKSLKASSPVQPQALRVNGAYPEGLPLQSTPPSLLLNLPPLPQGLQYRIVGHDLILLDSEANLIVDFISNAVPVT
jgi:hypothetical protein